MEQQLADCSRSTRHHLRTSYARRALVLNDKLPQSRLLGRHRSLASIDALRCPLSARSAVEGGQQLRKINTYYQLGGPLVD